MSDTIQNLLEFGFIYLITWWLVLFPLLSIGVERDETPDTGNDAGAPRQPYLKTKLLAASVITIPVTLTIMWVVGRFVAPYLHNV